MQQLWTVVIKSINFHVFKRETKYLEKTQADTGEHVRIGQDWTLDLGAVKADILSSKSSWRPSLQGTQTGI